MAILKVPTAIVLLVTLALLAKHHAHAFAMSKTCTHHLRYMITRLCSQCDHDLTDEKTKSTRGQQHMRGSDKMPPQRSAETRLMQFIEGCCSENQCSFAEMRGFCCQSKELSDELIDEPRFKRRRYPP